MVIVRSVLEEFADTIGVGASGQLCIDLNVSLAQVTTRSGAHG